MKKLPIVYDAHYSINELIKDVSCLRTTQLHPCHTSSFHDNDPLSLKIDPTRIEPTGSFISNIFARFKLKFRSIIDVVIQCEYEEIDG